MPTIEALKDALIKADSAGDTESAQIFADMIKEARSAPTVYPNETEQDKLDRILKKGRQIAGLETTTEESKASELPNEVLQSELEKAISGEFQGDEKSAQLADVYRKEILKRQGQETPPEAESQPIVGAAEAALTAATGATGGLAGMVEGAVEGIVREIASGDFGTQEAAKRIEELALERAAALTYAPRTETGQKYTEALGDVGAQLTPLAPLAAEAQLLRPATTAIRSKVGAAGERIGQRAGEFSAVAQKELGKVSTATQRELAKLPPAAKDLYSKIVEQVKAKVGKPSEEGFGRDSVGAARVQEGTLRQTQAGELPVPIKLTEGQKTRDFVTQRFERETAKLEDVGAPLRERFDEQNLQIQQNFDEFIDQTGAELTTLRGVGESVYNALKGRVKKDKDRIRVLYKEAEKSGEMESPVTLDTFINHLNESAPEAEVANVLKAVRAKAIKLGAASEDAQGNLIPSPIKLKDAELLRRTINAATNQEPTNIRQAAIMKDLIDEATDTSGGKKYKRARKERARFAKKYENVGLIKNILGTKRGSEDRAIAYEDVVRKAILEKSTPLDSLKQLRRLLQPEGEAGKQAWKELQGATLRDIQQRMTKGVALNQRGEAIVSPAQLKKAIDDLEQGGKLQFLFGKKGAEQLETIKEVAQLVLTSPPGSVNTSNTATVLAGLMDLAIAGSTGIPAPVTSGMNILVRRMQDKKLAAKVKKALE